MENEILIIVIILLFLLYSFAQQVNVIYFTGECRVAKHVDKIIETLNKTLPLNLTVYRIDSNFSEVKYLRQKYKIYGVPFIIINGKPLKGRYTENNIRKKICKEFFIPPKGCDQK